MELDGRIITEMASECVAICVCVCVFAAEERISSGELPVGAREHN